MDALAGDVFRDKRIHLNMRRRPLDLVLDVLIVRIEPPGKMAANLHGLALVIHELDSTENDNAQERIRPAAFVLHAIVDHGERRPRIAAERVDLVPRLGTVEI